MNAFPLARDDRRNRMAGWPAGGVKDRRHGPSDSSAAACAAFGCQLPLELRNAGLERTELLAGAREDLGLHVELLARCELEALQPRDRRGVR